jgi:outer membrane protein assembly factor BamB
LALAFGEPAAQDLADVWPEFRGPTGQGISAAKNVPTSWSPTKNIKWRIPIPGRGWSSPVVSRGRVYLTTALAGRDTDAVSLRALCVNAADGKILWDNEVFLQNASGLGRVHQKNTLASPTPIIQGERLYVHFGHLGTAALNLEGEVVWRQTELRYDPVHGNGGSPILVGDTLVFNGDGARNPFVAALDAGTGKLRWKTDRDSPSQNKFSFSTPLELELGGSNQIISAGGGLVAAYEPRDGSELWRVRYGEGFSIVPRPVFAQGLLFVSTGFDRPEVLAIRPEGATGDVTDSRVVWSTARGAPLTPSMIAVSKELYFVSDGGIATCADAQTGKVHWTERLGGNFSASPVYAEGRIYFQSEEGIGLVIKHSKSFEVIAKNNLDEPTLASYAVIDRGLFIRSQEHLWHVVK